MSDARERVLAAAERLFVERGYSSVTVKDIAKAVGIHHASLYHHIPDGKEKLFIEVMERNLTRHRAGIEAAIAEGGTDLRQQLQGIARWFLSQLPMDMIRMTLSDMPAIDPHMANQLSNMAYDALMTPLEEILRQARVRGDINHPNVGNVAGAILSSIQGLHTIPAEYMEHSREEMADELIELFLKGMA